MPKQIVVTCKNCGGKGRLVPPGGVVSITCQYCHGTGKQILR